MAYPSVAAYTKSYNSSDTTSHTITLPSGISAGNLLVVLWSCDAAPSVAIDTGYSGSNWETIGPVSYGSDVTSAIFWKVAEGSDVLQITTGSSQQSTWLSFRITGADTVSATSATGNGTNPNPPSHSASDSEEFLWLEFTSHDARVTLDGGSSGFADDYIMAAPNTSGASSSSYRRTYTGQTLDPGATSANEEQYVVWTIAVGNESLGGFEGVIAQTGATKAQAASGTLSFSGSIAQTGAAKAQAATGKETFSGSIAQTGATKAQAATGGEIFSGAVVQVGASKAQTASGTVAENNDRTGSIAQTGTSNAQSATGALSFVGSVAQTGAIKAQTLTGKETFTGAAAQTGATKAQAATGSERFSGAISQVGASKAQSISGAETFSGSVTQVGATISQSASGLILAEVEGVISQTVTPCAQSAAGAVIISGAIAQVGAAISQLVTAMGILSGSIAQNGATKSQAATGALGFVGSISQTDASKAQALAAEIVLSSSGAEWQRIATELVCQKAAALTTQRIGADSALSTSVIAAYIEQTKDRRAVPGPTVSTLPYPDTEIDIADERQTTQTFRR